MEVGNVEGIEGQDRKLTSAEIRDTAPKLIDGIAEALLSSPEFNRKAAEAKLFGVHDVEWQKGNDTFKLFGGRIINPDDRSGKKSVYLSVSNNTDGKTETEEMMVTFGYLGDKVEGYIAHVKNDDVFRFKANTSQATVNGIKGITARIRG